MRNKIISKLEKIEKTYNVKVLYACESGSRAWGFESKDSDFDVRFIYMHDIRHYLDIQGKRDVIELPINGILDINGWDLKKTLNLLKKSNPTLIEWLNSPIIYKKDDKILAKLRKLAKDFYKPKSCYYHYINMANSNYRQYLKNDIANVKKYLYVLRPLLAVRWIERYKLAPPTEFEKLFIVIKENEKLLEMIKNFVAQKRQGFESKFVPRLQIFNDFIENELKRHQVKNINFISSNVSSQKLNDFFLELLM